MRRTWQLALAENNLRGSMVNKRPISARTQMREPVDAATLHGCPRGHFYINPSSIDVYTQNAITGGVSCTRITKKQLKAALRLMERV